MSRPYTLTPEEHEMIERSLDLQAIIDASDDMMTPEEIDDLEAFMIGE